MSEFYSKEERIYSYLTIKGLNTYFGLNGKDFDLFIIKELLDNALDFIEQNAKEFVNGQKPFVDVIISEEDDGKVTKIQVRNSNAGINNLFTKDLINKIFDLKLLYSSKRYKHQINRGELGDAFKAILCIPYAIVINNNEETWDYPLEINIPNSNRSAKIKINNIDKIRRKQPIKIDPQEYEETNDNSSNNRFTEIVVYLPRKSVDYNEIRKLLRKYAVLNTHINFDFKMPHTDPKSYYHYPYEATQELKNDWKNKQSIYSYTLSEIEDSIHSLDESYDNLNAYDKFIHTEFREGRTLLKDEIFKTLTFGELKSDKKQIEYVIQKLKNNMKPIQYQSKSLQKLEVPFDWRLRKEALEESLKQVYKIEDFVYKRFEKYCEDPDKGIQFPYILEIVIAKSSYLDQNRLTLIESVNFSPSLNTGSLFRADDFIFHVKPLNLNMEDIITILQQCGYDIYNNNKHKKPYNLIIVNLISPRIEYKSYSKSNINVEPFANTFANEFFRTCKSPPPSNNNGKKVSMTLELTELLKKRLDDVTKDPKLKITRRWTQSTAFYLLRPILNAKGVQNVDKKRPYITGLIKKVCNSKELGYKKRHELGIIAAERAQLYSDGQAYGISFDRLEELMKKGTDLLVIEKEGIADILMEFANKRGIAILNSRGFLTEYAEELSELAEQEGCNIAVLTDLDPAGLIISTKIPNGHRIGIDFRIIDSLDLDYSDIEEDVTNNNNNDNTKKNNNHLENLKKFEYKTPKPYSFDDWDELINYLDTSKRIEIDGVLAAVRDPKVFWNYILNELDKVFPKRDYNRSINVNNIQALPKPIEDLIAKIDDMFTQLQSNERKMIIQELANKKGFVDDVDLEKQKIKERLISPSVSGGIENLKETLYELIKKL